MRQTQCTLSINHTTRSDDDDETRCEIIAMLLFRKDSDDAVAPFCALPDFSWRD